MWGVERTADTELEASYKRAAVLFVMYRPINGLTAASSDHRASLHGWLWIGLCHQHQTVLVHRSVPLGAHEYV